MFLLAVKLLKRVRRSPWQNVLPGRMEVSFLPHTAKVAQGNQRLMPWRVGPFLCPSLYVCVVSNLGMVAGDAEGQKATSLLIQARPPWASEPKA